MQKSGGNNNTTIVLPFTDESIDKQCEIITILGDRVRAGKVLMLVIDVAWLVFGPGLFGVVHRQGETMFEDVERCHNV